MRTIIRSRRKAGFTLLELLVVVAVLAIVSGGLLVAYDGLEDDAAEGVSAHTLATLDQAVRTFSVKTGGHPDSLDSCVAADYAAGPGVLVNPEVLATFPRPDKFSIHALTAGELAALNAAGIGTLRYVDVKGNDPVSPLPDSGATVTLDAPTHDGSAADVGALFNIDIPGRAHETPRPGSARNRGRGFAHTLEVGDSVLLWDNNRSGGTGGYDAIKMGAGPDDMLVVFGLGNDASMIGTQNEAIGLPSAPVYGKTRQGTFDYNRYLLVYNLGPSGAPYGTAKLQVILNSHGDFVDEMISEHAGQKL